MSAATVTDKVKHNDKGMGNSLMSAQELKGYDHCCGIHGAARERKGIKRGTNAARRRNDKQVIEMECFDYLDYILGED